MFISKLALTLVVLAICGLLCRIGRYESPWLWFFAPIGDLAIAVMKFAAWAVVFVMVVVATILIGPILARREIVRFFREWKDLLIDGTRRLRKSV